MRRLKLVNKMIYIQISKHDLNFSCKQWNFFIYINDITVINIHDMQSEKLFIWIFFNNFTQML